DLVQLHELVLEVFNTVGDPPMAFAEGIAEVYGCGDARWVGASIDRTRDLKPLLESSTWEKLAAFSDYVLAGAFTRFLIDVWGKDRYVALYRNLTYGDSLADIDKKFVASFGTSLDAALAAWRATGEQRQGAICRFLIDACADSPLDTSNGGRAS